MIRTPAAPDRATLQWLGLVIVGASVGVGVGQGRPGLVVGGLAAMLLVISLALRPRSVLLGILIFAIAPAIRGVPVSMVIGGRAVYFTDLLLPLAALWVLCFYDSRRQRSRLGLPIVVFVFGLGVALVIGLRDGADMSLMLRDLRGPLCIACSFVIAACISRREDERTSVSAVAIVLWVAAALVIVESAGGLRVLGGRVEDVSRVEAGASTTLDATRFILGPTNIALFVLCVATVMVVAGRRPRSGWLQWAIVLVVPSLALVFFSFSRRSILAAGISAALGLALRPSARSAIRLASLAAFGAATLVLLAAAVGGSDSYVGGQVSAFEERVLSGLASDSRSEDLGLEWRSRENEYAVRSFRSAPIAGHGFGAVYRPDLRGQPFFGAERLYGRAYVHSFYLWWLVKGGLVGLGGFVLLIASGVKDGILLSRRHGDSTYFALAVGIIGLASVNFVAPIFNETPTAVFLGCLLGWLHLRRSTRPDDTSPIEHGSDRRKKPEFAEH